MKTNYFALSENGNIFGVVESANDYELNYKVRNAIEEVFDLVILNIPNLKQNDYINKDGNNFLLELDENVSEVIKIQQTWIY